jgi:hypothetical protein
MEHPNTYEKRLKIAYTKELKKRETRISEILDFSSKVVNPFTRASSATLL